jgi:N-carbamoyl-L-amino-acid hydrolase
MTNTMEEPSRSNGAKTFPARMAEDWAPDVATAMALFDGLAVDGAGAIGITRDSYGAGEARAHARVCEMARDMGLEIRTDAALNLYMTMPGEDRSAPVAMTGSHLDSVPCGGNFDGAAGVVAGLTVLSRWRRLGYRPPHDCTVMAIRAEESAWFPVSYIGSKAGFGLLAPDALDVCREDTQRTLAAHIDALGGESARIRAGEACLDARRIGRFIEVHIEQGPVLVECDVPVGIVTGIRGAFRFRHAQAHGQYAHSGAAARATRKDAVVAVSRLVTLLDQAWDAEEGAGRDLVVTFGRFATDPMRADFSKVSGHVAFSIDVRSVETETLQRMEACVRACGERVAEETGVALDFGLLTRSEPALMDVTLRARLCEAARERGVAVLEMASGAGHDSAIFAGQGVPSAMIFVRNDHGSHNPDEAMEAADFLQALWLLEAGLKGR